MSIVTLSYIKPLTLDALQEVARDGSRVAIGEDAKARIALGRAVLQAALDSGTRVYGLNTGLGHTRDVDIPQEVLDQYQVDIVTSHAFGIGDALGKAEVRALMLARLAGACRGYSGLSLPVASFYADLLNADVVPHVPREGTVGASDLGTLGAVAATMIGRGAAYVDGVKMSSAEALARAGLEPVVLGLKEGLAAVSENSYSIGIGALALGDIARTLRLADVAAALTMEAARSSLSPFDPEVAVARPFAGQAAVARSILALLDGSYLNDPLAAISLQDPLSIRTVGQVHGAARRIFDDLAAVVETELNASDDNPMTSPDSGRALSTGNFHPMEIALGFEAMRIGLAHLALTSERRVSVTGSELWSLRKDGDTAPPASAILHPGIGGYASASILTRIRTLANPVTLNVPALDHGQEDHATAAPMAVDFTRQVAAMLDEMLITEITVAAAVLSRRPAVPLGAGTRPYYDAVVHAAHEGPDGELGGELIARVAPRLLAMTPRTIAFSDDAPPIDITTPTLLHTAKEMTPAHESHEAAAG